MKAFIMSDLHCDFWPTGVTITDALNIPEETEVIILAGDLGTWEGGLWEDNPIVVRIIEPLMKLNIPVLTVTGNHEYYGSVPIHETDEQIKVTSYNFKNWYPLQNGETFEHKGYVFIGATGWTKLAGKGNPAISNKTLSRMNDSRYIYTDEDTKLDSEAFMDLHNTHMSNIERAINSNLDKRTVVITHHSPTWDRVPLKYAGNVLNYAYVSHAAKDIKPDVWISGHIHTDFYKEIDGTLHIANPFGYPGEDTLIQDSTYTI